MKNYLREQESFSQRLRQSLASIGFDERSPTRLAREFNRRFEGKPISVNAARKWLFGESVPAQDKLRTLAHWLGVAPEWLRFGENSPGSGYVLEEPLVNEAEMDLVRNFRRLNTGHRQAIREMVMTLLRAERQV